MRKLLVWFLGNIIATKASYDDWFELYDSRTGSLENLDQIPNYKSVYGDFWYDIRIGFFFIEPFPIKH